MGSWYRYAYSFPNLNDYPKLAVWPDGYYISYNMFEKIPLGYAYAGAVMCAYDHAAMLAGDPLADSQCTAENPNYFSYLPSDLDGFTSPPAGADNYVLALGDDQLLFWTLDIDWADVGNSLFTGPTPITVAGFTDECEGYARGACIPQVGTTTKLESLGDRAMFRLPYRNFGDHESLVLSHSVDTGGEISGIRWYEIRDPGGTPTVHQSGTYSPDSNYRWMGSMAMDRDGNMALGYSVSSDSMNPSIWYTGRLATDPLNELPQSEEIIQNGTGSQTGGLQRWGDYSTMSVDPVDDCTFWYTQEYLTEDGSFNWHTRIASFSYPSCTCTASPPTNVDATPEFDNAIGLTWDAVSGATEYRIYRSTTSGAGYAQVGTTSDTFYTDDTVHGGVTYYYVVTTYDGSLGCESGFSTEASATATGPCGLPPTFSGISSAASNLSCAIDLSWPAATAICGGPVSYSVYRSTTSGFTPSLANRIAAGISGTSYTDGSGLAGGTTYYYVVRATDDSNGQEDTNTTEESGLPTGPPVPTTLYGTEDFESYSNGDMAGWTRGSFSGSTVDWRGVRSCSAHSGSKIFRYGGPQCSLDYRDGNHTLAYPPAVAVPAGSQNTRLSFFHRWDFENGPDGAYLRVSFDGINWSYVDDSAILQGRYNNDTGPWWSGNSSSYTHTEVDLDAVCNSISGGIDGCQGRTIFIGFAVFTNASINYDGWYIDDVTVTAGVPGPCQSTPSAAEYLTARSTSGEVKLEWVNPTDGYGSTRICRGTTGYPTDPNACPTLVVDRIGTAGAYDYYNDFSAENNTKYYYTAFVNNGSNVFSGGVNAWAYPFDSTNGKVKWSYSSAASSLAPTGVRPGAIGIGGAWAVSNDRILHGMNPTADGGDWPRASPYDWTPMAMNGPAQARPPVVPTTAVPFASQVVFLGSEDGHVYAVNAYTGATLWQSPKLGNILLANPSGMFTDFGGSWNLLFIGSRDATADNVMYALNPADGSVLYQFDNGGGLDGIGIISSGATVDYTNNRIYFASRTRPNGAFETLWCLSFSDTGFTKEWALQAGDMDGAPVLYQGRLYIGNNNGNVSIVDPDTGAQGWIYPATGDGPVKGFITPQGTASFPRRLYFSTTNTVWSITDEGGTASDGWSITTVPGPSIPLAPFGENILYVGSSDGSLYQLDAATGNVATSVELGDGNGTIGSPALDVRNEMAYVGSESGAVYAVELPLQEVGP
jgi:outer membrane protein assembly factor BamB/fibronectin type 3 domain-containing protein